MYFVFVDGNGEESGSFRLHATTHDAPCSPRCAANARPLAAPSARGGEHLDRRVRQRQRDLRGRGERYRHAVSLRSRGSRARPLDRDLEPTTARCCTFVVTASTRAPRWRAETPTPATKWRCSRGCSRRAPIGCSPMPSRRNPRGRSRFQPRPPPRTAVGNDGARIAGDACGDAIALTGHTGKIEGDTFGAKDDAALTCGSKDGGPDLFYRVDLAHKSRVSARITSSDAELDLVLLHGCSDTSRAGACGHQAEVLDAGHLFSGGERSRGRSLRPLHVDLPHHGSSKASNPRALTRHCSRSGGSNRPARQGGATILVELRRARRPALGLGRPCVPFRGVQAHQGEGLIRVRKASGPLSPFGGPAAMTPTSWRASPMSTEGGSLRVSLEPGTYYAVVDGIGVEVGRGFHVTPRRPAGRRSLRVGAEESPLG